MSDTTDETVACDYRAWNEIPQYSDVVVKKHIGQGTFSNVYLAEVPALATYTKSASPIQYTRDAKDQVLFDETVISTTKRRGFLKLRLMNNRRVTTDPTSSCQTAQASPDALAMKCLRPQATAELTSIGKEDMIQEATILASLKHPNIAKLHGRGKLPLFDDFILLERLVGTLDDRIDLWKKTSTRGNKVRPPQIETMYSIADALRFLHSRNIVYRDLKPENCGYDSSGQIKIFDFGFCFVLDDPTNDLLYERCGTPRYMSPETALFKGTSLPTDVYSFGILLWEVCALKKPFAHVKSMSEFERSVFENGSRPKVKKCWPATLKNIMTSCWSESVHCRPTMDSVKSELQAHILANIRKELFSTIHSV